MSGRRSPSYGPPRRTRSPSYEPPSRRRSPSYEPPRGAPRRESPPYEAPTRGRSPSYEPPGRKRTPSLEGRKGVWRGGEEEEGGVSPPRGAPVATYSRGRSRSPRPRDRAIDYPWEDQHTLRTLNCKACNVFLHDRDSMVAHLKGAPHLSQQQRLRDKEVRARTGGYGLNEVLKPDSKKMNYDDRFWLEQKGKNRKLKPEQERYLDTDRLNSIPAKFDKRTYDHGQFTFKMEENYCEKCDVWTKTRDQMQAHKEGANHRKMSVKIQRFRCNLCLIDVPCQLELEELRKTVKILRAKVQEQKMKLATCRKEHGTADMVELRRTSSTGLRQA